MRHLRRYGKIVVQVQEIYSGTYDYWVSHIGGEFKRWNAETCYTSVRWAIHDALGYYWICRPRSREAMIAKADRRTQKWIHNMEHRLKLRKGKKFPRRD